MRHNIRMWFFKYNKPIILTFQDKVAQVACKSACSHIAKAILDILISEDVKQISMGALQQVNLDTIQCERKFLYFFNIMFHHNIYIFSNIKIQIITIFRICCFWTSCRFTRRNFVAVLFAIATVTRFIYELGLAYLFSWLWSWF